MSINGLHGIKDKPFPYTTPDKHLMMAPKPTETTIQIVKDVANYIYDTYGRFPAFVDPMYMRLVFQSMHIDPDFYDEYYPKGFILRQAYRNISCPSP